MPRRSLKFLTLALASLTWVGETLAGTWSEAVLSLIMAPAGSGALPRALPFLIFLSVLCLLEGAFLWLANHDRGRRRRLEKRLRFLQGLEGRPTQESLLKSQDLSRLSGLNEWLKKFKGLDSLRDLMAQAHVEWPLGMLLLISLILGALGLSLGYFRLGVPGALAGLALGMALPVYVLRLKKKARLKKFEKQLPEALDLLARGLKAGHAFSSGLQLVAQEMPNPLGLEFYKAFKEYNYGLDVNSALKNMCQRVDLKDLKFFTTAVMIQRETGGNLTEILEKISALIRERFKLRNQIKALTAEGRLSGMILLLLPPLLALAMFRINPDYILVLKNHPLGRTIAMAAVGFQLMGMLVIRKIVNLKV